MPTPRTSDQSYEFSADENKIFDRLVRNLSRSGLVVIVASVILIAYHVIAYFGVSLGKQASSVISGLDYGLWFGISIIGVVIGALLVRATTAFAALIRTEGDDLAHLMQGVTRLASILTVVFWAAVGASVLLAISFTLLLMYS